MTASELQHIKKYVIKKKIKKNEQLANFKKKFKK
jgi:hypothetical protein